MNRFLIIASFCLAAVAVAPLVAEESRLSGRWNLDAQETLRQNYPAMKVTAQKRVALFPGNLLLMELPPVKS